MGRRGADPCRQVCPARPAQPVGHARGKSDTRHCGVVAAMRARTPNRGVPRLD